MLHVTSGEFANLRLRGCGLPGDCLAWNDPLYQGPVPAGVSLAELSRMRAEFLAETGWESTEAAQRRFRDRDLKLKVAAQTDAVTLWSSFELTDQLQLLQVLTWFEQHRNVVKTPEIVWVWDHLGADGPEEEELLKLFEERRQVTEPQQGTAADLWQAFTAPAPSGLETWHSRSLSDLPFMQKAIHRLLQEYPSLDNGLSRSEQQMLESLEAGPLDPHALFLRSQQREERRFMDEGPFWLLCRRLLEADPAPIQVVGGQRSLLPPAVDADNEAFSAQTFELTAAGHDLLGHADDFMFSRRAERWVGGTRIGADCPWRWDEEAGRCVKIEP